MTQSQRLLAYLYSHPGASSLEITGALWIVNVTGRVSDLRAAGHNITCSRRSDGRLGYTVVDDRPAPLAGTQETAW